MSKPVLASYCTTFLKPEMNHIYRQVTALQNFETFVVARERREEARFPFPAVEMHGRVRSNFARRFWLKYIKKEPPIVYRGEYGALARILDRRRADFMHVYFGHTGVHLLPFIRRWPKPTVVSFHGMDVQPREDRPGYVDQLRAMLRELPMVLVRSGSLARRLEELGCDPAKIRLNRTGIPLELFPQQSRRPPEDGRSWRLVQACRLIEKKGLDVTLRVFARFRATHPGARLVIAGGGPLEDSLRSLVGELEIEDGVEFVGFVDSKQLADLFTQAHVFIHPSRLTADQNQEGIPNAMLEAMSTGLPILATRHGGIPEAVTDGSSGLLVEEDDEAALLDALLQVTGDVALWERLGSEATRVAREEFGQAAQIARLEGHYEELLGGMEAAAPRKGGE